MVDDKLSVSELMTTSLIALPPVVPVRRLVDTLRMCAHQAFPVTPEVEKALGDTGGRRAWEPGGVACAGEPAREGWQQQCGVWVGGGRRPAPAWACAHICPPPADPRLLCAASPPARPLAAPAAGEPFELHGVILRSTLLHLLRSRRGLVDPQQAATLLARQAAADGGDGSRGGGARGPGRAVLAKGGGSNDYAAAAAAQQLE